MFRNLSPLTAATLTVTLNVALWGLHSAGAQVTQDPRPNTTRQNAPQPAQPGSKTMPKPVPASGAANRGQGTLNQMDRNFITKIGHGNVAEVQTGKLALQKAANADVKRVAQTLITEHGQAQEQLKTVAQNVSVAVPNAPDSQQKAMYNSLSKLNGAAFDRKWLSDQIKAHDMTIALLQKEISQGSHPDVKAYAQQTLPKVQMHTMELKQLGSQMGVYKGTVPKKAKTATNMKGM